MNKQCFIFVFIFALSLCAIAQNTKGTIEFGFNSGINFSKVGNSRSNSDMTVGFNIGASADYFFSNRWSIKSKLIYDQKGWDNGFVQDSYIDPGLPTYVETDFDLEYLTIPIMANWHFGKKRNWYLNFGPYTGFLIGAKETTFGAKIKEDFNTIDFGLSLGVGVKIPVSTKLKISLEYEDQAGFTDIFRQTSGPTFTNSRSSFNVGLIFQ
jgi:opacity protein-like surface antigen